MKRERTPEEEAEIRRQLEVLRQDAWHRRVVSLVEQTHGAPLPIVVADFLVNSAKWSGVPARQAVTWLRKTIATTDSLIRVERPEDFTLFWTRLYVLLDELIPFFDQHSIGDRVVDQGRWEIAGFLREVRRKFSDEDLTYIEYMRNCCTHAFQSSERIKIDSKNMKYNRIAYTDKLTGIPRTPEERELLFASAMSTYGSEDRMAVTFAGRAQPFLHRVGRLLDPWALQQGIFPQ